MSDQYFRDRYNTSGSTTNPEPVANSPVVNSDPYADKAPMDSTLVNDTPAVTTAAPVIPMYEMPVHQTVSGNTVPYSPPVNEMVTQETQLNNPAVYAAPVAATTSHETPIVTNPASSVALLTHEESEHFRMRWSEIQGKFVDEPRAAVQQADALVSDVIGQITQTFAQERNTLDSQWNQGSDVSTEDLRKALQHYRSFFNRLMV